MNDKYLVSGSNDGSCVVWKLSDFKPIKHLITETEGFFVAINDVALYNDPLVLKIYGLLF